MSNQKCGMVGDTVMAVSINITTPVHLLVIAYDTAYKILRHSNTIKLKTFKIY